MDRPERNLGFLLHEVARLMRKRFEQNVKHLGVTRSQCQVLAHLSRNDGIQQGMLADLLEVEPITLTRILDRLEEAGLVERQPHPTDRRVRLLRLTEAAYPLLDEIFAIGALTQGESMEGLPDEERERLFATLSAMKVNLLDRCATPAVERRRSHG